MISSYRNLKTIVFSLLLIGVLFESSNAQVLQPYYFRNVKIGGGGYVTGLVAHPTIPDRILIRTDVGGAYEYSPSPDFENRHWVPTTDVFALSDANYYGIESIALSVSEPGVSFIAAGRQLSNPVADIFKWDDANPGWQSTGFNLARMGGNEAYRWTGERLAVDPVNGQRIFFGSRDDGMFKTTTAAFSWSSVAGVPDGTNDIGVSFISYDPGSSVANDKTYTVYAGVDGSGVYISTDAGDSWSLMAGSPQNPRRGTVASNGDIYITDGNGVHLYDGSWNDITPDGPKEYCAMAVHPNDPLRILTAERISTVRTKIYRSTDGGASWTTFREQNGSVDDQSDVPWWTNSNYGGSIASLTIDPTNPNKLYKTSWSGVWMTDNVWDNDGVLNFYTEESGHEELVVFTLSTPPGGNNLFSGVADGDGFRHTDVDNFPATRFDGAQAPLETSGIDFHEADPNHMVRVVHDSFRTLAHVLFSDDNGVTWTASAAWDTSEMTKKVAYSATDSDVAVVLPWTGNPKYTLDRGQSWLNTNGLPTNVTYGSRFRRNHALAADRVAANTFYLYHAGIFYRSTDGGANWTIRNSNLPVDDGRSNYVEAVPGAAGEVWVSLDWGGLFHSTDGGTTFEDVSTVWRARTFGLGILANQAAKRSGDERTGEPHSALASYSIYMYGRAAGATEEHVYRSDDAGDSWIRISETEPAVGATLQVIRGDRQVPGKVYIGTGGRGVWIGEPEEALAVNFDYFGSSLNSDGLPVLNWKLSDLPFGSQMEVQVRSGLESFSTLETLISSDQENYTFQIPELESNFYQFRIVAINIDGSRTISAVINVDLVPEELALLEVYPNPTSNFIHLNYHIPGTKNTKVEILDLLGRRLSSIEDFDYETTNARRKKLDVSMLPSGKYILRVSSAAVSMERLISVVN